MSLFIAVRTDRDKQEITQHLLEWAIFPDRSNAHRQFAAQFTAESESFQRVGSSPIPVNRLISSDLVEAAKAAVRDAIASTDEIHYREIADKFENAGNGFHEAPNIVFKSDRSNNTMVVKLKDSWRGHSQTSLDPLVRFTEKKLTDREYYFDWAEYPHDPAVQGHIYEGILLSYAINTTRSGPYSLCPCRRLNGLRWTGGSIGYSDMECIHCQSVFEIKTKANMEAIEKSNKFGTRGGSLKGFWMIQNQKRKTNWKHYLVLMSREPSYPRGGIKCWEVQIAEIDRVVPQLSSSCFLNYQRSRSTTPKSKIYTKTRTKQWFEIPFQAIDQRLLVSNILESVFPGIYDDLEASKNPTTKAGKRVAPAVTDLTGAIDQLRKELNAMTTRDCWDDSSDDE